MKNVLTVFVLIVMITAHPAYVHRNNIAHALEDTFSDRADIVLNANVVIDENIETFKNETYGDIQLVAGSEPDFGFRHILARHTKNYFVNFNNKNNNSMFDDEVSGTDLIYGIRDFYEDCVDIESYNRNARRNIAYVGFTEIDGDRLKCLLIVRRENKQIVTFYPLLTLTETEALQQLDPVIHRD